MRIAPDRLRRLIPLSNLTQEALEQLTAQAEMLTLDFGEEIYALGSVDENIYYLLDGEVCMEDRNGKEAVISSDSEQSRYAFGKLNPRPASARVSSDMADILCFNRNMLDTLLSWHQQVVPQNDSDPLFSDLPSSLLTSELQVDEVEVTYNEWVMSLLKSQAFYNVPPENIQELSERMIPKSCKAGDIIIEEGDPGDFYYVIREGQCRVIREGIVVGNLGPLDTFGEEALISGSLRNATIEMITDGLLMQLSQDDFLRTLVPPMIKKVSLEEARSLIMRGAIFIDVRNRREFKANRLVRSINLPLYIFRSKLHKLSHKKVYVVYCDTGKRSSVATFLLTQQRFDAFLLTEPQEAFKLLTAGDGNSVMADSFSDIPSDMHFLSF